MALAVVGIALSVAHTGSALAQVNGGSTNVRTNPGFACAPGTNWVNDGGVARCQTPTAAAPYLASCPSLSNFAPSGACQFDIPATGAGVTVSAPTKTTNYVGQTTLTCNAGTWGPATTTCTPIPTLTLTPGSGNVYQGRGYTFGWTSSDATSIVWSCSGANPSSGTLVASGTMTLSTDNIGSTSCQVEATGPGGSSGVKIFNFYTDVRPGCPNTSYTSGSCSYDVQARPDGGSGSFNTSTPGYAGNITASCSMGTWSFNSATCAAIPPADCTAKTLPASGCSFSFGAVGNGASSTVSTSTPGYTGTATASCSNGTLSVTGSSCSPAVPANCVASSTSVGACSYSVGALTNGSTQSVSTTTSGYTGTASASCSSGVVSWSGASCTADFGVCPSGQTWNGTTCVPTPPAPVCGSGAQIFSTDPTTSTWNMGTGSYGDGVYRVGRTSSAIGLQCTSGTTFNVYFVSATATTLLDTINLPVGGTFSGSYATGWRGASGNRTDNCTVMIDANSSGGDRGGAVSTIVNDGNPSGGLARVALNICTGTAAPTSPTNCTASSTSVGACSYSVGALTNGSTQSVSTTTSGYTGTASASCSSGVVSWSGGNCTVNWGVCPSGQTWNGASCSCPAGQSYDAGTQACVPQNPWAQPAISVRALYGRSAWGPIFMVSNTVQGWAIGTLNVTSLSNGTLCTISAGQTCNIGVATTLVDQFGQAQPASFMDIWNSCTLKAFGPGGYVGPVAGNGASALAISAIANADGSLAIYTIDYIDNSGDATDVTAFWNYGVIPAGFNGSTFNLTNDSQFDALYYGRCAMPSNP